LNTNYLQKGYIALDMLDITHRQVRVWREIKKEKSLWFLDASKDFCWK